MGFGLNGLGYVGTGHVPSGSSSTADFWAYDPGANAWSRKADVPGGGRFLPVGFGLNGLGYVGTGYIAGVGDVADFWAYGSPAPTILTGALPASAYCVGSPLAVVFTATGTFAAGNVFTAQLSDASGSFAAPTTIGTLTSATASPISVTLPTGAAAGTGYRIRVVGSSPATTGSNNGSNLTLYALPTAVLSGGGTICSGSAASLSVALTGMGPWSLTYTDGTTPVTTTASASPFAISVSPTSNQTYTLTAVSDAHCTGTSFTGSAAVVVNAPPVVTALGNQVLSNTADQCGAAVAFATTATGTPAPTLVYTLGTAVISSPYVFPVGTSTVTATATNSCGKDAKTFTVIVNDTQKPTITTPTNLTANTDAGACAATLTVALPAVADNCPGTTVAGVRSDAQPLSAAYPKGTTTITWTATDAAGNTATATQLVTVTDNIKPTITAPAALTVSTDPGQCSARGVVLGAPTTADNCSVKSVTTDAPAAFPKGPTTVTWTVTDGSGNTATVTQVVTVTDTEKPVLSALANLTVKAPATQCDAVVSFNPTATDNCAGATVVARPASGSTFPVGTTTVTVTATDASGNSSTGSFTVTVTDVTAPTVVTQNLTVPLANGAATVTADAVGKGSSDACGIQSLVLSKTSFTCANIGPNTVTLTVTDIHGNVSTGMATVTVTGTIPTPSIAVTPSSSVYTGGIPTTLYLDYGPQSVTLTASDGVSYAWSGPVGLSDPTIFNPVFTASTAGTFTYTVTATSTSGCTATASVTLKVVDARCGNKNDKVLVCHNGHELCLSPDAVNTHLTGHPGDQLGACPLARLAGPGAASSGSVNELAVYPNPAVDQATVSFRPSLDGTAQLVVYNALGQRVASLYDGAVNGGQLYSLKLDSQNLATGLYECRLVVNGKAQMQRLIIAR